MTIGGAGDKPTLLVFLAHWCPHCNREVPELIKLNDAGGIPADLDVIGISTASHPDRAELSAVGMDRRQGVAVPDDGRQ